MALAQLVAGTACTGFSLLTTPTALSNGKVSILTDFAELGSEIDKAKAAADIERLQEQLRHEHDANGAAELARAHARLSAAGGVAGTSAASH